LRIALCSKAFLPNVGGIETSTAMIARTWHAAGHEVEVVTATPDPAPPTEPFRVTRAWGPRALAAAVGRADLAACNGYSRAVVAAAALLRRQLVVFHQGYHLICSDGLGFRNRQFHDFDTVRDLRLAFAAGPRQTAHALGRLPFDAVVRAWPGGRGITHVVPSRHVARRLGLPRFEVIYQPPNPAVVDAVAALGDPQPEARARAYETGDIVFFGRLVFEKGCDDLIRAYALWRGRAGAAGGRPPRARLVLHGRGPELGALERLVAELGVGADVDLRPFLGGPDLARAARAASVVVIPSRWEEPGATIAVELYACGAAVIASQTGAQGEIFADHGRLFPNRDVEGLSRALEAHFAAGPVYPRPSGDEPWSLPAIQRALVRLPEA
jgi:glycogen synthase